MARRLTRPAISVAKAAAALLGVVCLAGPLQAAEEILSFESTVIVRADGVLDVTESIVVRAEGDKIKRGIFRDLPLTFVDEAGDSHRVSFRLVEVARDGKPEPHHTVSNSSGVRIYAGKEDVFLSPDLYRYRIRYETGRQIRFVADHTELFWNVTGNDWAFPIQGAAVVVRLPDDRAPVRWTAYTGRYGERGQDFSGSIGGDNRLAVAATRALSRGEGLSVVVEIPDGLIAEPSGWQTLTYWYVDNRRFVFGGLGILGVLAFYLATWAAVGRDPPKGTIIPLFHPPPGVSPALVSYIRHFGWSGGWRPFIAGALSLAVKGLLVFDDSADTLVLSRTKQQSDPRRLPPGERSILKWVEDKDRRVTIDSGNGTSIATALSAFKSSVEAESRNRFFQRNLGYFIVGLVLTAAALAAVLFFGDLSEGETFLLFATGFVGVFIGTAVVPIIRTLSGGGWRVRSVAAFGVNVAGFLIVAVVFLSIAGGALLALPDFADTAFHAVLRNSFPFTLVGGFAAMNGLFYYLLKAPTAAGRKVMDAIEGLELYIRTAEGGRFNLAGAPDLDAKQFERLLPYAVALDAEKPWSEAFATAFARAHPGGGVVAAYAPGWHAGDGWSDADFGRSIWSSISAAQGSFASSTPAPSSSSSGFGGGGGSGGGGGGGGGGGW